MKQVSLYLSFATALLGFALTWHSVRATPEAVRQIKRKQADYAQLLALKHARARSLDVAPVIAAAGPLRSLEELLGDRKAQVHARSDVPLVDGWTLRSADVVFEGAALADAASFLAAVENARPPWRVSACAISAAGDAGLGRATFTLEAPVKRL